MSKSPRKKGYVIHRLICSGYTLLFIVTCIASLLMLVLGGSLQRFVNRWFPILSRTVTFLFNLRSLATLWLLILIFTGLYTLVPVRKHSMRSQIPGALFSTAGWIIFSALFSVYFNNFSNYSYMYGSLTAVVVLMLWLYICICILLIGAEINYFLERHNR